MPLVRYLNLLPAALWSPSLQPQACNPFPLILKGPPLPNIKIGFRGFHFNIRGVSGAYGYDWDYCSQTVAPEP